MSPSPDEPGHGSRRLPSAMLTHVVLFALKPDAAPHAGDRLVHDALHELTRIPGVRDMSAGRLLQTDTGFEYAIAMHFDDEAALQAYRVHPIHQEYVAFLKANVARIQGYDFVN